MPGFYFPESKFYELRLIYLLLLIEFAKLHVNIKTEVLVYGASLPFHKAIEPLWKTTYRLSTH